VTRVEEKIKIFRKRMITGYFFNIFMVSHACDKKPAKTGYDIP
jgi:hypothetical protein